MIKEKSKNSIKNIKPSTNNKNSAEHIFFFESYGVKISFSTNSAKVFEGVKKALKVYLPDCVEEIGETETEHNFYFVRSVENFDTLYKNDEELFYRESLDNCFDIAASRIRLTVAEFAVDRVFIHAGVVAWKNKAIIIPGKSFRGKTALTVALVERGAIYYSDEFAIIDPDGLVHSFPKMLSVRGEIDAYRQIDYPVEKFGGTTGTEKIEIGMILVCEYKENARWNPKSLTKAKAIIEMIANSVAIRQNPQFTIEVLNKALSGAKFFKSKRGDILKSADVIFDFIDQNL